MAKKDNDLQPQEQISAFLGTIFVSNPVAKIEIGLFAFHASEALGMLKEFAEHVGYPIVDYRVDPHLIIDRNSLDKLLLIKDDTLD